MHLQIYHRQMEEEPSKRPRWLSPLAVFLVGVFSYAYDREGSSVLGAVAAMLVAVALIWGVIAWSRLG